jgi:hypothetical protein
VSGELAGEALTEEAILRAALGGGGGDAELADTARRAVG